MAHRRLTFENDEPLNIDASAQKYRISVPVEEKITSIEHHHDALEYVRGSK